MKSLFLLIVFILITATSYSQGKITDRERDDLFGPVKTVKVEWKEISGEPGQKPEMGLIYISQNLYAQDGRISEELAPDGDKVVFTTIDGFKTFRTVMNPIPKGATDMAIRAVVVEEVPIEIPEKITDPDRRFDFKYVYEFDENGRVRIERQFQNNGKLWHLRAFKYGLNGKVSEEIRNDTSAVTRYTYMYDKKGLLVEKLEDRDIKGKGTDSKTKTVYSEYVVDEHGNWTARKEHLFYSNEGLPEYKIPPEKWELSRMQFRTITYY